MTKELLSLSTLVMTSVLTSISAKQPNIVVIYTDDQPLRAMSNIDPYFSTPNIDMLATKGILFENNFVCTSVSCVSRASILTGQHSLRHGVNSFDTPLTTEQMQQTYPGLLRKAGYRTAFLGKFGIGHPRAAAKELFLPADQFDL
jgi:arylsulfatase A-like enzyme